MYDVFNIKSDKKIQKYNTIDEKEKFFPNRQEKNTLCTFPSPVIQSESNSESNSESDEIKLEIVNYDKGKEHSKTYTVPHNIVYPTRKRLLCFSVINGEYCNYGSHCTFAHTLAEQKIDIEMLYIYQIILDKDLMHFFSLSNPKTDEIYKRLLFFAHVCPKCVDFKCMGGYNCKYGTHAPCLKICKNDLLTGQCINKLIDISVDQSILDKIKSINYPANKDASNTFSLPSTYVGCMNGHHLSERNLIPYYTYINKKDISKKTIYQSVRYIDIDHVYKLLKNNNSNRNYINSMNKSSETSESTDDEINQWFKHDSYSSDDEKVETLF